MLKVGDSLPDFALSDMTGKVRTKSEFMGKPLVLYFYPKDDTPGCTTEACSFRDTWPEYQKRGVQVLGVSADTVASHAKFVQKYDLPFTLLADPDKVLISACGAWGEKKMYGKSYEGILRSTFVFDAKGTLVKVFPKVSPDGHAQEILAGL